MDERTISCVREYVQAHRTEIIRDLCRLAAIPSIRGKAEEGAPYGIACADALREAVNLFRENGFPAECCSGNRYGLATYGEGSPTLGLFGHTDVVPVGDDWELTEPFTPIELDGYLIGRGVEDNKAGVVTALYVLRAFRDLRIPLKGRILVFLGAAEETGMEDIEAFCGENSMPDLSIVPDNEYPVCLGEKGMCHLFARADTPFLDITGFSGGLAFNVILDRVTVSIRRSDALAAALPRLIAGKNAFSLNDDGKSLTLTAKGLSAHASVPDGSVNAAYLTCDLLRGCEELSASDRSVLASAADLLETVHGEVFGIVNNDAYFGPVTSANGIAQLTDGALTLSFDIRYGTSSDPEILYHAVESALHRKGFSVISPHNRAGFRLDENAPAARGMMEVYRTVSGETDCRPYYSGGGTYARDLKNAYSIGCAVPYLNGNRTFSPGHGRIHQSDESILIDGLLESVAMATLMVAACEEAFPV